MFRRSLSLLLLILPTFASLAVGNDEMRKWRSADGKQSVVATFIEATDEQIKLRRQDGRTVIVPMSKLSQADQDWIVERVNGRRLPPSLAAFDRPRPRREMRLVASIPDKSTSPIVHLELSTDDSVVVVYRRDGSLQGMDVNERKWLPTYEHKIPGGSWDRRSVAISADGQFCAAIINENVHVWNVRTAKSEFVHEAGNPCNVAIAPNGEWVFFASPDGSLFRYPLLGGRGTRIDGLKFRGKLDLFISEPDSRTLLFHWWGQPAIVRYPMPAPDGELPSDLIGYRSVWGAEIPGADVSSRHILVLGKDGRVGHIGRRTDGSDSRIDTIRLRQIAPENVRISRDEKRWAATGNDSAVPFVEIARFGPYRPETVRVPKVGPRAIGHDAMTLFVAPANEEDESDGVHVFRINDDGEFPDVKFMQFVMQLLKDEEFEKLDTLWKACRETKEEFPWGNRTEDELLRALGHNPVQPEAKRMRRESIAAWLKSQPESELARLIQANEEMSSAWTLRGTGMASTVPEDAWNDIRRHVEQADDLITPILALESPPAHAFYVWFAAAKLKSRPAVETNREVARLLKVRPDYFVAHAQVAEARMPRWGGAPTDTVDYCKAVADHVGGPEGDALYARLAHRIALYFSDQTFPLQMSFDFPRIARGIEALSKEPDQAEFAANLGLYLARRYRELDAARAFAKSFLQGEEMMMWHPSVWRDWKSFEAALRWGRAYRDARELLADDPSKVIDLLALTNAQRDASRGEWKEIDGILVSPETPVSQLRIPISPPEAYELTMEIERLGDSGGFSVGLFNQGYRFGAHFGHYVRIDRREFHKVVGLSEVDDGDLSSNRNPTVEVSDPFHDEQRKKLTLKVTPNYVDIFVDDQRVTSYHGEMSLLRLSRSWTERLTDTDRLWIGSEQTPFAIHSLQLRALDAATLAKVERKLDPLVQLHPKHGAIDLLAHIDPVEDAIKGGWRFEDDALISPVGHQQLLRIPCQPPLNYLMEVEVTRISGDGAFVLNVPIEFGSTLTFDTGDPPQLNWRLHGLGVKQPEFEGRLLPRGERKRILIAVSKLGCAIDVDDKEVVRFSSRVTGTQMSGGWTPRQNDLLAVGASRSKFHIHKMRLIPVSAGGKLLRAKLTSEELNARNNQPVENLPAQEETAADERIFQRDPAAEAPRFEIDESTDLLKLIDTKRDTVAGNWELEDGVLVGRGTAVLEFPAAVPDEYILTLEVEPINGKNALLIGLANQRHQFNALLRASKGGRVFNGLAMVNGKPVESDQNPTRVFGNPFQDKKTTKVDVEVRKKKVSVWVDNVLLTSYEGDMSSLSLHSFWGGIVKDRQNLWIGMFSTTYGIHRAQLSTLAQQPD